MNEAKFVAVAIIRTPTSASFSTSVILIVEAIQKPLASQGQGELNLSENRKLSSNMSRYLKPIQLRDLAALISP